MDFVTSALLGGALYDLVASPIKLTGGYIKAALENVVNLDEKVAKIVSEELSKEEFREAVSKEVLIAQIEASKALQEVIVQLNKQPQTVININAYGNGDAFHGDKVIGSKTVHNEK